MGHRLGYFNTSVEILFSTIWCPEKKLTLPIPCPWWFLVCYRLGCISSVGCLDAFMKASCHTSGYEGLFLCLVTSIIPSYPTMLDTYPCANCSGFQYLMHFWHWGIFLFCVSSAVYKLLLVTLSLAFPAVSCGRAHDNSGYCAARTGWDPLGLGSSPWQLWGATCNPSCLPVHDSALVFLLLCSVFSTLLLTSSRFPWGPFFLMASLCYGYYSLSSL